MKKTSDIESLYQTIEQNPNSYQEIVQTEQANESLGRWSLISAIHQMDDSKEAHAIHPKAAIKSAPVHQRVWSKSSRKQFRLQKKRLSWLRTKK